MRSVPVPMCIKVDFAYEAAIVYSDALEECFSPVEKGSKCVDVINNSDRFYKDYLSKTKYTRKLYCVK